MEPTETPGEWSTYAMLVLHELARLSDTVKELSYKLEAAMKANHEDRESMTALASTVESHREDADRRMTVLEGTVLGDKGLQADVLTLKTDARSTSSFTQGQKWVIGLSAAILTVVIWPLVSIYLVLHYGHHL